MVEGVDSLAVKKMDESYALGLLCAGLAVLYYHEYLTTYCVVGTLLSLILQYTIFLLYVLGGFALIGCFLRVFCPSGTAGNSVCDHCKTLKVCSWCFIVGNYLNPL